MTLARTSAAQLAALGEVHDLLEREGVDHWLFGGWAVDFYANAITRAHDDVDLAVWADDAERVAAMLEQTGWTHAPSPDEDGGTGYDRDPVRLELTFLVRCHDGSVGIPLRQGDAPWIEGAFADELLELEGARCRVLGYAPLMRTKSSSRDGPGEQAKDAGDVAVLWRLRR